MIRIAAVGLVLALASCSSLPATNAPAVNARAGTIQAGIVQACVASGMFRMADTVVMIAVPISALPLAVINAGVDRVCADPARYARDAATVEWVVRNLRDQRGRAP